MKGKRKFYVLAALLVALAVMGGTFAHAYTTASTTISMTAPSSDFATVTAGTGPTAPTMFGSFTGTWPSGTLFTITPAAGYTGDLVIRVYLTNAAALSRYYENSNMLLEFLDSSNTTADEQQSGQDLTLDNGGVEFTWANGTGTGPYTVQLTGGSYRLNPWKSLVGGSVSPQLWIEVKPR